MRYKCKNVEEARSLIHLEAYVGYGRDHLLIPVPGTTRWVRVWDAGFGEMDIDTSRPRDIITSQALSVWGESCLEWLDVTIACHGEEYGPPHSATREEWEDLFNHLPHFMPNMTGRGYLAIDHYNNDNSYWDELLGCLPPALPRLVVEQRVGFISPSIGMVSGRAVLAFMATIQRKGWLVEAGVWGCKVIIPGSGEVVMWLDDTRVVGTRMTLEDVRSLNPSPLNNPSWMEKKEGDNHYVDMEAKRRQKIKDDFNKALEEGVAETCRGRVVLLGRGGVGKTSVKNALLGLDFSPEHDITELLDIQYATVNDEGIWEPLNENAMKKHEEHHLVALAIQQNKQQNALKVFKVQKQEASQDMPMTRQHEEAKPPHMPKKHEEVPAEVEGLLQEGEELEKKDRMSVWDFAGQLIYYTVHQLFLSKRTIIVLVTDGSQDLEAPIPPEYAQDSDDSLKTEKDYVKYFLKTTSIWGRSERANSEVPRPCQPPHAFILLNKADLVSPEELQGRLESVKKLVRETPAFDDIVREVLPFTSNPAPGDGKLPQLTTFEESCSTLKGRLKLVKQDFVDKIPIKWLRLRNKLQENPYTSFHRAVEIAQSLQIEEDKVKSVLLYFHEHRELLYWDTEGCNDIVVCQPTWLINEMRKIITVQRKQILESQKSPEVPRLLDLLSNEKILNESLAKELWKENHEVMIRIMQKYLLLLPWTKDKFARQQYLVPCILKAMEDTDPHSDGQDIPPIYFYLHDKVIPIGFTSRLVTLLATKGWNDGDKLPTIYFNGAHFILKEENTYVRISLEETCWKPCVGEEWKDKRERMEEQTVIQVRAELISEINQEVRVDAPRCLNRARITIEEGIMEILSMINVSQSVVTAEESPCKHKLLPPETRVCNICMKSYGPEVYGAWFGEELNIQQQDRILEGKQVGPKSPSQATAYNDADQILLMKEVVSLFLSGRKHEAECAAPRQVRQEPPSLAAAYGDADRGLMSGELSWAVSQLYKEIRTDIASKFQGFVVDDKTLKETLDKLTPGLKWLMHVNPSLIAKLMAYHVLDTNTKEMLTSVQENATKVQLLLDHINQNTKRRFPPLLLSLQATHQTEVLEKLNTKDIRDCLNLDKEEFVSKHDVTHDFVHDDEELRRLLVTVEPYLLTHMKTDPALITQLQVHHVLDDGTQQKLQNPVYQNLKKVNILMTHISSNTRKTFLPFLLALKATGQTGVIEELDTLGIKRCLNLKIEESSLLDNLAMQSIFK